jgi:hypothetical protein
MQVLLVLTGMEKSPGEDASIVITGLSVLLIAITEKALHSSWKRGRPFSHENIRR